MSYPGVFSTLGLRHDTDRWVLSRPLIYKTATDWVYVPVGFKTDLASVPRIPGVYAVIQGRANKAAVVHDWLYSRQANREYADRLFYRAMRDEGVGPVMAWLIYAAVRVFGWFPYRSRA